MQCPAGDHGAHAQAAPAHSDLDLGQLGGAQRSRRGECQHVLAAQLLLDPLVGRAELIAGVDVEDTSTGGAGAGVKRVLVLVNEFYLKPLGLGTNTLVAGNAEKGFFESLLGF